MLQAAHWSAPHIQAYALRASGSAGSIRIRADTTLCDLSHMCGNRIRNSSIRICNGTSGCTSHIPVRDWDLRRRNSEPRVLSRQAAGEQRVRLQVQQELQVRVREQEMLQD